MELTELMMPCTLHSNGAIELYGNSTAKQFIVLHAFVEVNFFEAPSNLNISVSFGLSRMWFDRKNNNFADQQTIHENFGFEFVYYGAEKIILCNVSTCFLL